MVVLRDEVLCELNVLAVEMVVVTSHSPGISCFHLNWCSHETIPDAGDADLSGRALGLVRHHGSTRHELRGELRRFDDRLIGIQGRMV